MNIRLFIACISLVFGSTDLMSQDRNQDLSFWTWFQVNRDLGKHTYGSLQYQVRLNNNMSAFQANNFYCIYGYNLNKRTNLEGLYQINTNRERTNHTLYLGLTRQFKVTDHFSIYTRTAVQHGRNLVGFESVTNQPTYDWRNRFRVKYKFNKTIALACSAEPTMRYSLAQGMVLDKIRFASQFSFNYNKYQSITLFYMFQPDVISFKQPMTNYILGATYQLELPKKFKKYKKILKPNLDLQFKEKMEESNSQDLF